MNWPTIHHPDPKMQGLYENVCSKRFFNNQEFRFSDRDYPVINVLKNGNYVIHKANFMPLQSAWNSKQTISNIGPRSGWIEPKTKKIDKTLCGDYVAFCTWFNGNYGHTMHDSLPYLAWLKNKFPNKQFILFDNPLNKKLIKFIDQDFYEQIFWIKKNETVNIQGELIVSTPDMHPCIMHKNLMKYLMKWFKQKLIAKPVQKNVIYYDRSVGVGHGRILNHECQNQILNSIRSWMSDNQIEGDLVLFSGTNSDGSRVSIEDQFDIFRGAHTIIGPHGTGLVNIMWSDLYGDVPIKLIEFIPGGIGYSSEVQTPFQGYHNVLSYLPIDYHCLLYEKQSTNKETFINIDDLKSALTFENINKYLF